MAQPAYNLEHFAPQSRRQAPRIRVAKRVRSERQKQFVKMLRTLAGVLVLVLMVCGVLYNNVQLAEVQSEIASTEKQLAEENALNFYLSFELDNKTSFKNMEERAEALGLERVDSARVTYFRVEEGTGIEVKENPFVRLWNKTLEGFMSILEYLTP